jgi:hypothetical protein
MSFKALLRRWQSHPEAVPTTQQYAVRLPLDDAARVLALAELYHLSKEEVITDLLHAALHEITESMPYEPGTKVIREDDHGDPVYEDRGPMPRFLELMRRKRADLEAAVVDQRK